MQRHFFFGPTSWGPGEWPKGQISLNIIKFKYLSQFQRFLNQTLCVFTQMKDIKHIRPDCHLAAWVMLQGWNLGVPWGAWGVQKFNQIWCVCYLHEWHMQRHHFWVPVPWGPGEEPKGQISLNLNYSQFQRFLNQTLLIFSQMKDI